MNMMLLRQLRLGNNLPMHIRENTGFLQQKPRQLPSAEANFEGWVTKMLVLFLYQTSYIKQELNGYIECIYMLVVYDTSI